MADVILVILLKYDMFSCSEAPGNNKNQKRSVHSRYDEYTLLRVCSMFRFYSWIFFFNIQRRKYSVFRVFEFFVFSTLTMV